MRIQRTDTKTAVLAVARRPKKDTLLGNMKANWQLYLMIFIPFLYILVFKYFPMFGAQIAFRDYKPAYGIWQSEWVGLKHFNRFVNSAQFWTVIRNTVAISVYSIALTIPFPIILAIGLDYVRNVHFKKTVQMVVYLPHFLSTVIVVGVMYLILDNRTGIVNNIIFTLTGSKINFLGKPDHFRSLYVLSGIWQSMGWNSILYMAALAGVDPQIHEAAIIDGANKLRRIWHIDLASIKPTIAIMIVMNIGTFLSVEFDKTLLMQNATNLRISEVLSTYEYKMGIGGGIPNYSYASAIGLMSSVVTFILICVANKISNKLADSGLW